MSENLSQPILPITIVPLDGGRQEERSPKDKDAPSDLRHWQIEEFLRQKGLAENTQRSYRRQLKLFSAWCNKSWLDVTPNDIGKYRRELKQRELKPASINHALNTLRAFYQWLRRSNGYLVNQPLPTDAIGLERVEEPQALHIEQSDLADIWQALSTRGGRVLLVETSGLPDFERTRAFYRKCGYDEEARIRDFYKAGDDKLVFRKALVAKGQ